MSEQQIFAPANLLAVVPAIRAADRDWKAVENARIEAGYAWEPIAASGLALVSVRVEISKEPPR